MRRTPLAIIMMVLVMLASACGLDGDDGFTAVGDTPTTTSDSDAAPSAEVCADFLDTITGAEEGLDDLVAEANDDEKEELQHQMVPVRQLIVDAEDQSHALGCEDVASPSDATCNTRGVVRELLQEQGYGPGSWVWEEEIDHELAEATRRGNGAFSDVAVTHRDDYVEWINGEEGNAPLLRENHFSELSDGSQELFESGEGFVFMQTTIRTVQTGNTVIVDGVEYNSKEIVREAGDVLVVFVGEECEVEGPIVRAGCGNPQTVIPVPERKRVCRNGVVETVDHDDNQPGDKPVDDPSCRSTTTTTTTPSTTVPPTWGPTTTVPTTTTTVPTTGPTTTVVTCESFYDDRYHGDYPDCTKESGSVDGNEPNQPNGQNPFVNTWTQGEVDTPDVDPEPPLPPVTPPAWADPNGDGEITAEDLPTIEPPLAGQPDRNPSTTVPKPSFDDS